MSASGNATFTCLCLSCCPWSCFRSYFLRVCLSFPCLTMLNVLYNYVFPADVLLLSCLCIQLPSAGTACPAAITLQTSMRNIKQRQINMCRKYTLPAAGEKRGPGCHRNGQFAEWQNFSCVTWRLAAPQVPEKHCVTAVFWTFQKIFKKSSSEIVHLSLTVCWCCAIWLYMCRFILCFIFYFTVLQITLCTLICFVSWTTPAFSARHGCR